MRSVAQVLRAQAVALRAQADALDALASSAESTGVADDPILDLQDAPREGVPTATARSWIQRGRLAASTAERGRYVFRRSALRAAMEAEPVVPRTRAEPVNDLEAWEREADKVIGIRGNRR